MAHHKLIDAAVRRHFLVRQLKLLLQLYLAVGHVELDGAAGEVLRGHSVASFWCVPLPQQSSSCWWDPYGKLEQRTQRCPFVLWSTTFPCIDLEAITWSRKHVHGQQAHASRMRDCHKEV